MIAKFRKVQGLSTDTYIVLPNILSAFNLLLQREYCNKAVETLKREGVRNLVLQFMVRTRQNALDSVASGCMNIARIGLGKPS